MNENLDKLNLNSKQSLKNQLDNISSLDGIKKGINSSNDLALNSNQKLSDVNNELDNITNNTHVINESLIDVNENLNDGLFTDTDPFEDLDLTDDGSDNFGDFENTIKDNMGFTYQNNMFGLAQAGSSGLVTISFSFYGKTMTIFQPSMMNGFPMASIRNLFLFFFALAGFITVFRTT